MCGCGEPIRPKEQKGEEVRVKSPEPKREPATVR